MKCEECGGPICSTAVTIQIDELSKGILLLSNVMSSEWSAALEEYRRGDSDVIVLFGVDPSFETKAQFFKFPEELKNG